jgi:ABC-type taurine transport system substrate-binding protein
MHVVFRPTEAGLNCYSHENGSSRRPTRRSSPHAARGPVSLVTRGVVPPDIRTAAHLSVTAEISRRRSKELNFYKEVGLDATVKWIVSGTDMPSLVASGQINFAGESVTTAAILRDKGIDVRYVMPTANIAGTQCFVVGPDTKLRSPKDLEGKKIGMAAGSGVAIAIRNMANQYGVDYTKLVFVNLQPPDQAPALARGDIDAMAVWQPWALAGMSLGGKLYFTGNKSYIDGTPLSQFQSVRESSS